MDRILRVVSWAGQVANLSRKAGNLPHGCLLAAVLFGLAVQVAWAAPNDREPAASRRPRRDRNSAVRCPP